MDDDELYVHGLLRANGYVRIIDPPPGVEGPEGSCGLYCKDEVHYWLVRGGDVWAMIRDENMNEEG